MPASADALWTDEGIDGNGVSESLRSLYERLDGEMPKWPIFAGFNFKYKPAMDNEEYEHGKDMALDFPNFIITTDGPSNIFYDWEAQIEKVKNIKEIAGNKQIALMGGTEVQKIVPCLPYVNYVIMENQTLSGKIDPESI